MFKILRGLSPFNYINKFKFISGEAGMGIIVIYIPLKQKPQNLGAKAWNKLPLVFRNTNGPKVFRLNN